MAIPLLSRPSHSSHSCPAPLMAIHCTCILVQHCPSPMPCVAGTAPVKATLSLCKWLHAVYITHGHRPHAIAIQCDQRSGRVSVLSDHTPCMLHLISPPWLPFPLPSMPLVCLMHLWYHSPIFIQYVCKIQAEMYIELYIVFLPIQSPMSTPGTISHILSACTHSCFLICFKPFWSSS